jgi:hypothetical protein
MSSIVHLPEHFKIVNGSPVATTNGGITCDFVSLKNVNMAWILVEALQAATHATVLNPQRATAVAPTGNVAIAHNAPWWKNADVATSDTLVRGADATTMSLTAGTTNQQVIIQIDPAQLGDTYDCMGLVVTTSGEANNYMTVTYFLEMRYAQATPPAAITD